MKNDKTTIIADEIILSKIYLVRGQKVMLDKDLAELYDVETKRLNEQVKRNAERFPEHFMFRLSKEEYENLRSQNATLDSDRHLIYLPYAFTEHGVLMLSNVLKSSRAIQMSIKIIDIFVKLREMVLNHKDILIKLDQLEKQVVQNSDEIQIIFSALKQLLQTPSTTRVPIGFKSSGKKQG
jgi:hypothetical protein